MLFDLDGTLVDTAPDLAAAANAMRTERGLAALPLEALRPVASQGARGLLRVALDRTPEHDDYITLRDAFLDRYERALLVHTRIFDGMSEVLETLEGRGRGWGIVTNKAKRFTEPLTRLLGLDHRTAAIVSGDTTAHTKPHPEPLLYAARMLGLSPADCVYVGDDHRDIVAGRAAGMQTIAAAWGYCGESPPTQWQADLVVQHPRDLVMLI